MNKSVLISNLSRKRNNFTEADIESTVNSILELISNTLSISDRVEVRNFGTFSVKKREKRLSRNPKTGTAVLVEAKSYPYFRASKLLKESLNQ
tara:strand:- start:170 stop:448 length:279 start_codon:yes stop_codon:yes gene_type:complete